MIVSREWILQNAVTKTSAFFVMRLDIFLKLSRLISSRTLAKEFTKAALVSVNGLVAKSSRDVSAGDEIEITRHNKIIKVKVLIVPSKKQVSKKDALGLYEIISEELLDEDPLFGPLPGSE